MIVVYTVIEIHIYSNRVIGIELKSDNERMHILSVYLPAVGNIDSFAFEFNLVEGLNN